MPQVDFTPFKSWHLKLFKHGEFYARPNIKEELRSLIFRQVIGYTILLDGEIAAIMGVVPLWDGVGEVTFIPSDTFYKHKLTGIKVVKELLRLAFPTLRLHRIQACSAAEHPKHGRFLEMLGFEFEGTLRGYGPDGEDYLMYACVEVK